MRQRSNRYLLVSAATLATALTLSAVAMGAVVIGDGGANALTGTDEADRIVARGGDDSVDALAGRDLVVGNAGDDRLNGGRGCDRVFAGAGNDTVDGGPSGGWRAARWLRSRCERLHGGAGNDVAAGGAGRDFMSGGFGDDRQQGGLGSDKLFANQGRDVSDGGEGRDVLWALSRKDVSAIGDAEGDELSGGEGSDRFHVRDGEVDLVHCGGGFRDRVRADQFDAVDADCERVFRREVTSLDQVEDGPENRTEDPAEDHVED